MGAESGDHRPELLPPGRPVPQMELIANNHSDPRTAARAA